MGVLSVWRLSYRSVPAEFRERLALGPDRHTVELEDSGVSVRER